MKYRIALDNRFTLQVWPTERTVGDDLIPAPDHILDFQLYPVEDNDRDEGGSINVTATQLYGFFDWLQKWCPDPRPQPMLAPPQSQGGRLILAEISDDGGATWRKMTPEEVAREQAIRDARAQAENRSIS